MTYLELSKCQANISIVKVLFGLLITYEMEQNKVLVLKLPKILMRAVNDVF